MQYRKKPVVIEAMQFTTNNEIGSPTMDAIVKWGNQGKDKPIIWHNGTDIYIQTLEGEMKASVGDYIIKGVQGEFYPCKPDIFNQTYERVEDQFCEEEKRKELEVREEFKNSIIQIFNTTSGLRPNDFNYEALLNDSIDVALNYYEDRYTNKKGRKPLTDEEIFELIRERIKKNIN